MENIIVSCANVGDCKYYQEYGGEEYQGRYEFYDLCWKNQSFCPNKICIHKIKFWINHPCLTFKYLKQYIHTEIKVLIESKNKKRKGVNYE